jgi:PAS domain S-box-containing protein
VAIRQNIARQNIARQNIAETVSAYEALQTSELRYRRLFEAAKDGILILDAASGQIIDVNPFIADLLGYSKDELIGKHLWEIGAFQDVLGSKAAFVELQERGYIRYENLPLETRSGLVRQVEFVSNSYLAGTTRVIQCNIRDITERKLAEKTLKKTMQTKTSDLAAMTQQLWQASKLATMGELAASIAHELNNPLAIISLRVDSLARDLANDERKSHMLKIIAGEVKRMGKLIGRLLQFSRHSHQQISTLDIRKEIENSLELFEYHLRARKIEVVREFDTILPAIQADAQQLCQIFLNLLTNATDAMPQGGTLVTRVTSVKRESGISGVRIELTDSGPGITPANLQKIWEPFFTTKPEGKGTGLGLAISRRAIEANHGTISIVSQLGIGTTVTIFLPATGDLQQKA